jgi:hypothetical protein
MYGSNTRKAGLGLVARGLKIQGPYTMASSDFDGDEMSDDEFEPDMNEVGNIFGRLLMSAPVVHMLHLQTDSFAKHLALNDLYHDMPDLVDAIIEEFQSEYGIVSSYDTYVTYNANPVVFVEDLAKYLDKNRGSIASDSSIQANIDTLVTAINSCLYKIKNLK